MCLTLKSVEPDGTSARITANKLYLISFQPSNRNKQTHPLTGILHNKCLGQTGTQTGTGTQLQTMSSWGNSLYHWLSLTLANETVQTVAL